MLIQLITEHFVPVSGTPHSYIYWNYYPTSAPLLDYLMEDRDILPISLAGAKVSIKSDITKYFKKV